ncbi:MAG: LysO family transporter [Fermentimonas sp.]|nr:LysO family transporter [Fermentimonas sp.]
MFIVIAFMILGVVTGYIFRNKKMGNISKIITVIIWVLLFLLGVEVGTNPEIIAGLGTIGVEALIITIAAVLGSAIMALLLWRYIKKSKK